MKLRERCLKKLRSLCLALPETSEIETWGNPTFRFKKSAFAVLDEYHDSLCVAVRVGLDRQQELVADPRYFETPYSARHGWASLRLDTKTDWEEVRALVLESYQYVAPPRK